MLRNRDLPASPLANGADGSPWTVRDLGNPQQVIGMTKREMFILHAMQVVGSAFVISDGWECRVAELSVKLADAVLDEAEQ
jgi:hypothetical protein